MRRRTYNVVDDSLHDYKLKIILKYNENDSTITPNTLRFVQRNDNVFSDNFNMEDMKNQTLIPLNIFFNGGNERTIDFYSPHSFEVDINYFEGSEGDPNKQIGYIPTAASIKGSVDVFYIIITKDSINKEGGV